MTGAERRARAAALRTGAAAARRAAPRRTRVAALSLRDALWYLWVGMGSTHPLGVPLPPQSEESWRAALAAGPGRAPSGPGPGHPEQLVSGLPPTRRERELWAQLADHGTKGRPKGRARRAW
jgi:Family of unknown function (DUF6059)